LVVVATEGLLKRRLSYVERCADAWSPVMHEALLERVAAMPAREAAAPHPTAPVEQPKPIVVITRSDPAD
jgi:hypothetical protein